MVVVADTCVVVTPILPDLPGSGVLMTNSGKFAHYAPSNTGYGVVYGSLAECVESAVAGRPVFSDVVFEEERKNTPTPNPSPQGGGGLSGPAFSRQPELASNETAEQESPSPLRGGVRGGGSSRNTSEANQSDSAEASLQILVPGTAATGEALILSAPISFWGGVDPKTGRVADVRHPQHGETVAGKVLFLPGTIGSSSASAVLLELVKNGHAPAALVLHEPDAILLLGLIVAREMGWNTPVALRMDRDRFEPFRGKSVVVGAEWLATKEGPSHMASHPHPCPLPTKGRGTLRHAMMRQSRRFWIK